MSEIHPSPRLFLKIKIKKINTYFIGTTIYSDTMGGLRIILIALPEKTFFYL